MFRCQHKVVGLDVDEQKAHVVKGLHVRDERRGDGAKIDTRETAAARRRRLLLLGRGY